MRLAVASDHAAVSLRRAVVAHLREGGHEVVEHGPAADDERVDYPTEAAWAARHVADGAVERAVLLCGTGIGVSIAANKIAGVRAALVHDVTTARLAAEHNDANVLCLGARVLGQVVALECVDAWLSTPFVARHRARLDLIAGLEGGTRGGGAAAASSPERSA
jgi:ribose 5-phosphate isomerase B